MSADMIDYLIVCAENRAMTSSGDENAKLARYQYDKLRLAASEAEALRAELREVKATLALHAALDWDACAELRSTVTEQARQIEAARELLDLFRKNSREASEGDCVYCNCEQGGGNDDDCYYDCPMNDVRAWLAANAPTPAPEAEQERTP